MICGRRFSSGWAGFGRRDVIAADYEAVLGGNPQLEFVAVADHVKGAVADDGVEADHAQHFGLAGQHEAANLLVFGDLALLGAADGGVDVHRGLHALDLGGFGIDVGDQVLFGGSLQGGHIHLRHTAGAEQASPKGNSSQDDQDCEVSMIRALLRELDVNSV